MATAAQVGELIIFETFMNADIGLSLPVAQPGIEDTLLFELQEQFLVASTILIAHGGFRRPAIIKMVDIVGLVDNSRLGRYWCRN